MILNFTLANQKQSILIPSDVNPQDIRALYGHAFNVAQSLGAIENGHYPDNFEVVDNGYIINAFQYNNV